jgi:tetratricopeptide (TPR) repeat protein
MMTIECTSCKKALDVDEKTLSPREPTALRCPSCGVTLMVDQRKAGRSAVTRPVVTLATAPFVPLPAPPEDEALKDGHESAEYASLVAAMFAAAEAFLHERHQIDDRARLLRSVETNGRAALNHMALDVPHADNADAIAAEQAPDSPAIDTKLARAARLLEHSSEITEYSNFLRPKCRAAHRYEPIVEWQRRTTPLIASAYSVAAIGSGSLGEFATRLRNAGTQFAELLLQHGKRRNELKDQIEKQESKNVALSQERNEAGRRVQAAEELANTNGFRAMKSGGCAVPIVAAVVAGILGAAVRDGSVAFAVWILAAIGGFFLAYRIGYGKTGRDLEEARARQLSADAALNGGEDEINRLRAALAAHEDVAPEHVERATRPEPWSLLATEEYDEDPRDASASTDPAGPRRLPIREAMAPAVSPVTVAPALVMATGMPQQQFMDEGPITSARMVGFRPGGTSRRETDVLPVLARSEVSSFDEVATAVPLPTAVYESVATPVAVVVPPVEVARDGKRKRAIVLGVVLALGIAIGLIAWHSLFSLDAKLEKALSRNEMFSPAGTSVYDIYKAEAEKNPGSAVLAKYRPRIHDALVPQGDAAFAAWYRDSDDSFQWQAVEQIYRFLALINPGVPMNDMRRLYAVGQQKIDAREYAQAIDAYQQALKLDPNWVLALNGIGKVYMIERSPLHDERLGIAYYERACAADPNFPWAPKNLGDYYLRKDDYSRAEHYLLLALAASPERASVLRGLGWVCRKTGRPQAAISYYARSIATEKDPEKRASAMKAIDAIRLRRGSV